LPVSKRQRLFKLQDPQKSFETAKFQLDHVALFWDNSAVPNNEQCVCFWCCWLTNAFPAAAAKGQVVVDLCYLVGYWAIHWEPVWVELVSIAPVARIPANSTQY